MAGTDYKTATGRMLAEQNQHQPAIILVQPQMGENIGAVARAMLNCGLTDLRLVSPRDGWPNPAAEAMASGAITVLERAQIFTSVADAIADIHYVYATTARSRDMVKPVVTPRIAATQTRTRHQNNQKTAWLFGPERAGLSNEDLGLADALLMVPLYPGFTSLNLAQAVLLVAYEWYQTAADNAEAEALPAPADTQTMPAPRGMLNHFFDRLEQALEDAGFFRSPDLRAITWRNVRGLFLRMAPTSQDIQMLHGILTALRPTDAKNHDAAPTTPPSMSPD